MWIRVKGENKVIDSEQLDMKDYDFTIRVTEDLRILRGFKEFSNKRNGNFDELDAVKALCDLCNHKWEEAD